MPRIDPEVKNCTDIADDILGEDLCGHLFNIDTSPFKTCFERGKVDPTVFGIACTFDVCYNRDDEDAMKQAACGTFQALAAECANRGIVVYWREEMNCGQLYLCVEKNRILMQQKSVKWYNVLMVDHCLSVIKFIQVKKE